MYTYTMYIHTVGQPVGWCIANCETVDVIEAFLGGIKARSPMIPVKVVIIDDGEYRK